MLLHLYSRCWCRGWSRGCWSCVWPSVWLLLSFLVEPLSLSLVLSLALLLVVSLAYRHLLSPSSLSSPSLTAFSCVTFSLTALSHFFFYSLYDEGDGGSGGDGEDGGDGVGICCSWAPLGGPLGGDRGSMPHSLTLLLDPTGWMDGLMDEWCQ